MPRHAPYGVASRSVAFVIVACVASGAGQAAQLQVEPILLELDARAPAGTLTLHNGEDVEVTVQTRVQAWRQAGGEESLSPTEDVVASPPSVTLAPNADTIVRIVRVSKAPVRGEESYRVLVDQLPDLRRPRAQAVTLLIRQSIPVFVRDARMTMASVSWSQGEANGRTVIIARNAGDEHLRIASLVLKDRAGRSVSFGNGLIGYVLGGSTMRWALPPQAARLAGPLTVTAATNKGPLHAASP